jgi:hypothetical protein
MSLPSVSYSLTRDRLIGGEKCASAGAEVYLPGDHDYGLALADTRATGREHISVTLSKDGRGSMFTVPYDDLSMTWPTKAGTH